MRGDVARLFETDDLASIVAHPPELWDKRFSQLSPAVSRAAAEGDGVAQEILLAAGENLAQMAAAACVQLDLTQTDVEIVLAGGAYRGISPILRDKVTLEVHRRVPRARVHQAYGEPVAGSLFMAAEASGVEVDRSFQDAVWSALPDGEGLSVPALTS
jgi:N-acetylglucosamine kinase-like BadF-type ATPase